MQPNYKEDYAQDSKFSQFSLLHVGPVVMNVMFMRLPDMFNKWQKIKKGGKKYKIENMMKTKMWTQPTKYKLIMPFVID